MGPLNGLSLVAALLLHEAGHWLGLRIIGRKDAVFRLLPLLEPGTGQPFARDAEAVFHALTGPAFSVAPMVLALALALSLQTQAPALAGFCAALTLSLGLLNAINLLPFHLLDGGRTIEAVARVLSPAVLYLSGASAVSGLALTGFFTGLSWTYAVAVLGLAGLALRQRTTDRSALAPREAGLAFTAWASLLAAHLSGVTLLLSSL
jgi:Zn-dependent protease